jgi:hypothetical protein
MRLLSPMAGLGLALLAAPLAMAQSYHHMNPPHAVVHHMAPVHHVVRIVPHHVPVRPVMVRHHVVMPVHHADQHHG